MTNSENASQVYRQRRDIARTLLQRIDDFLQQEPREKVNWTHAGSMDYIVTSLQEIVQFLAGEENEMEHQ